MSRGVASGDVPMASLQALDVALKHAPALKEGCLALPRAMFFPQALHSITGDADVRPISLQRS